MESWLALPIVAWGFVGYFLGYRRGHKAGVAQMQGRVDAMKAQAEWRRSHPMQTSAIDPTGNR
jgi:hypothetical protein